MKTCKTGLLALVALAVASHGIAQGQPLSTTRSSLQSIAAGQQHTVALRADGTLWVWGADQQPERVGSDSDWAAVTGNLALKLDGSAWSWIPGMIPTRIGRP